MILIDWSSIVMGTTLSHKHELDKEGEYVKHVIINNIRQANEKYRHVEGEIVICMDAPNANWRKQCFPHYKYKRKAKREDDPEVWAKVFEFKKELTDDLLPVLPYRVIQVPHAEADDVIGALVQHYREPHMIISGDGDFKQLQRYPNVRQFSTQRREFYKSPNPKGDLLMKIFEGDKGDGVPNVLSADDTFVVEGKRQVPLSKKRLSELLTMYRTNEWGALQDNWVRNKTLIDLSQMPVEVYSDIIGAFEGSVPSGSIRQLNKYLLGNNMKLLAESLDSFNPGVAERRATLF